MSTPFSSTETRISTTTSVSSTHILQSSGPQSPASSAPAPAETYGSSWVLPVLIFSCLAFMILLVWLLPFCRTRQRKPGKEETVEGNEMDEYTWKRANGQGYERFA
jgi:hypothetical protein